MSMIRTAGTLALAVLAAGCVGTDTPVDPSGGAAYAKGGNGGGGKPGSGDRPAYFEFASGTSVATDGESTYTDDEDGCVIAQVLEGGGGDLRPRGFEQHGKGKTTVCLRTLALVLERPHDPATHPDEPAIAPSEHEVIRLNVKLTDEGTRPIGAGLINLTQRCVDGDGRGLGLRFDDEVIPGSTTVSGISELVADTRWRITTGPDDVAGCIEASGDTTYWHVDLDFIVEAL